MRSKYLKNIRQRINSNKIAKKCSLSRYKRSRQNKINYMFVPTKNKKKKYFCRCGAFFKNGN